MVTVTMTTTTLTKDVSNNSTSSDPEGVSEAVMTPRKIPLDLSMSCTVCVSVVDSAL